MAVVPVLMLPFIKSELLPMKNHSVTLATLNAADGTTRAHTSRCVASWAKPPNFTRNSTGFL